MDLSPGQVEMLMVAAKLPVDPAAIVGSKLLVVYGSGQHISHLYTTVTSVTIHTNPTQLVLHFDGNLYCHREALYLTFDPPLKRGDKAGWHLRAAGNSQNHTMETPHQVLSVGVLENELADTPVEA